jgi:outer membrane protein assembly factor BamB
MAGMHPTSIRLALAVAMAPFLSTSTRGGETRGEDWPRFRGPGGLGIARSGDIPTAFGGKTGHGVLWKVDVPLAGPGSPVLLANRLFLTGAAKKRREAFCFDADSGKLLWRKEVKPAGAPSAGEKKAEDDEETPQASPTPAAEGQWVHVIFGNGDAATFDLEGAEVWSRGLGMNDNPYGGSASPVIWGRLLILQLDQGSEEDGKSRILALERSSGKTVWETRRPVGSSWSTPIVIAAGGHEEVITCADPWVIAHDPAAGKELWRARCLGGEVVPSPIFAGGLVVAASGSGKLAAIRPGGSGDVTATHIAWSSEDDLPDIPSPVAGAELLFTLTSSGKLAAYSLADGKRQWDKDLDAGFQASPTLAGDLLLCLSDGGKLLVLRAGRKYEVVARAEVGEVCQASPAFAPGRMYIRGAKHLYCFGKRAQ